MGSFEYEVASPRARWIGMLLLGLAATSAFACVALLWGAKEDPWRLAGAGLCALATVGLARRGRQRRLPVLRSVDAVRSLVERTGIPVALYLRRFADDLAAEHPLAPQGADGPDEAQLAESFSTRCLFVAIGRPGEPLPPWGAYRLYVPDAEWRRRVASLISISSIVVVRVGRSDALRWELQQLKRSGKLDRTLFLLPAIGSADDLQGILPDAARLDATPPTPSDTRYPAFVTLDADGTARVHERDLSLGYGESAARVATEALGLQPLGGAGRHAIRGFYGRTERLLSALTTLGLVGFASALAGGMTIVTLILLATLLPGQRTMDAVMDRVGPVLDPLLTALGAVAAVSIGLVVLMAVMRERLLP